MTNYQKFPILHLVKSIQRKNIVQPDSSSGFAMYWKCTKFQRFEKLLNAETACVASYGK